MFAAANHTPNQTSVLALEDVNEVLISGLRRNGTLRGRMIKRVACPVVPAPSGPLTTATVNKSCIFEQSQAGDKKYHQELLYPPHPDQVHHQSHYQQPSNLVYHPLLGPNQQHLPPSLPSSLQSLAVSSGSKSNNSSLVSLDIHAKNPSKYNNNLHRYSCISSSTATSSSSSSDRSEESEMVESWLSSIHFDEYTTHFVENGYDLPTISRMTPEDLIAIGITNPLHRKAIKHEISGLNVSDGIPKLIPESLYEWLCLLRLEEYFDLLQKQGYDSVDKVSQLMWEDFEEIGIKKLGHQKRLSLGIKRYNNNTSASGNNNGVVGVTSRGSLAGVGSFPSGSYEDSHYGCIGSINFNHQSNNGSSNRNTNGCLNGSFPDLTSCSPGVIITRPSSQLHNHHHQQHPHFSVPRPLILPNNENNLTDFDGTATLQRHQRAAIVSCSASFFNNKPVAMIAAKTRGSSSPGSTADTQSLMQFDMINVSKQSSNVQNCNGFYTTKNPDDFQPSLTGSASISSLHSVGSGSLNSYPDETSSMYMSRHNYSSMPSYDSSSSIYATLKRNKKPPPPPPKRTNSMKTNLGSSPSLSSSSTFVSPTRTTVSSINRAVSTTTSSSSNGFYSINNDNHYSQSYSDQRNPPSNQRPSSFQPPHLPMNSHRSAVDNFQDQAFATCVKSLTSRFSQMSTSEDQEIQHHYDISPPEPAPSCTSSLSSFAPLEQQSPSASSLMPPLPSSTTRQEEGDTSGSLVLNSNDFGGSCDFPPPPTPLCQSLEELRAGDQLNASFYLNQSHKTYPQHHHHQQHRSNSQNNSSFEDNSSNSSSSNESLPFANDKVGTIRQSASSHSYHLNCLNGMTKQDNNEIKDSRIYSSNDTSKNCKGDVEVDTIDSLVASLKSEKEGSLSFSTPLRSTSITASNNKIHMKRNITESLDGGNVVIDDIETMLANLSNQLDAMLEQEITPSSSLDQRYQHHNHDFNQTYRTMSNLLISRNI